MCSIMSSQLLRSRRRTTARCAGTRACRGSCAGRRTATRPAPSQALSGQCRATRLLSALRAAADPALPRHPRQPRSPPRNDTDRAAAAVALLSRLSAAETADLAGVRDQTPPLGFPCVADGVFRHRITSGQARTSWLCRDRSSYNFGPGAVRPPKIILDDTPDHIVIDSSRSGLDVSSSTRSENTIMSSMYKRHSRGDDCQTRFGIRFDARLSPSPHSRRHRRDADTPLN